MAVIGQPEEIILLRSLVGPRDPTLVIRQVLLYMHWALSLVFVLFFETARLS